MCVCVCFVYEEIPNNTRQLSGPGKSWVVGFICVSPTSISYLRAVPKIDQIREAHIVQLLRIRMTPISVWSVLVVTRIASTKKQYGRWFAGAPSSESGPERSKKWLCCCVRLNINYCVVCSLARLRTITFKARFVCVFLCNTNRERDRYIEIPTDKGHRSTVRLLNSTVDIKSTTVPVLPGSGRPLVSRPYSGLWFYVLNTNVCATVDKGQ